MLYVTQQICSSLSNLQARLIGKSKPFWVMVSNSHSMSFQSDHLWGLESESIRGEIPRFTPLRGCVTKGHGIWSECVLEFIAFLGTYENEIVISVRCLKPDLENWISQLLAVTMFYRLVGAINGFRIVRIPVISCYAITARQGTPIEG